MNEEIRRAIVARIAAQERAKLGERHLRVAEPAEAGFDRQVHLRRIRYLSGAYRLQWLVDQETWHVGSLTQLADEALAALLRTVERAIQGEQDGVSHVEAGIYRAVGR